MADFCQTCGIGKLGLDTRDLAGITTPEDTAAGRYASVLCEGCGPADVDHNGRRRPRVLNKKTDHIPRGAVYCGRPAPLGNPFIIGRDGTRDQVVDKYDAWVRTQPKLLALIRTLEGRDLVCFCAPMRCHCDVILAIANAPTPQKTEKISPARPTRGRIFSSVKLDGGARQRDGEDEPKD